MIKKLILSILLVSTIVFVSSNNISCATLDEINIPTAEVADYGVGEFNVRLYSGGGAITRIIFAPFNRFNIGGSLDIDRLISRQAPLIRDPQFYFKWRIFDGGEYFPAMAIGYDGQGYDFQNNSERYSQPGKGIFLVFTMNLFTKGLLSDFGANVSKYEEENKLFGFIGVRYSVEEILNFMVEYENYGNKNLHQLNAGIKFLVHKDISFDLIFKNIPIKENDETDRQIRVSYFYKFF